MKYIAFALLLLATACTRGGTKSGYCIDLLSGPQQMQGVNVDIRLGGILQITNPKTPGKGVMTTADKCVFFND